MAVGDIFRASFIQELHGQKLVTVTHWREVTSGTGSSQLHLAGQLDAVYGGSIRPSLSHEWRYVMTAVQQIYPGTPLRATLVAATAGIGGDAQDSIPAPSCITITLRTAFAGRAYRGRVFQSGVAVDDVENSQLKPVAQAAIDFQYAMLFKLQSSVDQEWEPVLWHRASNSATVINESLVRTPIRVQRRREVGRGQ